MFEEKKTENKRKQNKKNAQPWRADWGLKHIKMKQIKYGDVVWVMPKCGDLLEL